MLTVSIIKCLRKDSLLNQSNSISTDMSSSPPLPRITAASQNHRNLTSTVEEHLPDFISARKTLELAISQKKKKLSHHKK